MSRQPEGRIKKPGRIYTFYSYKGGTGRTMALANVAWIMASAGRRVLTIDWDLEAPGLHRYYHPFLSDPEASQGEGLIDFLLEFVSAAHQKEDTTTDALWFEPYANILPFAVPIAWEFANGGALHMVSAGRQDGGYAIRVTSFDWVSFYTQLGGGVFLEAVKRRLRDEYDYILIDSRTGLSDTSGICSVQMPDDLVCCFTLNTQSITGAAGVAESAFTQRLRPTGEPGLRVWPMATRVELGQREKLDNARGIARLKFSKFISHLPRTQRSSYMPSVEVLYQPYFAYEEILATIADRKHQTGSLLGSFENITRWITDNNVAGLVEVPSQQAEGKRLDALDKFTRRAANVKTKVYVAKSMDEAQAASLKKMSALIPNWYLRSFTTLADWLPLEVFAGFRDTRRFLALLVGHFGSENVFMRHDIAPLYSSVMDVQLTAGTPLEADVLLVSADSSPIPELDWAMKNKARVITVQFPTIESRANVQANLHRGYVLLIDRDDFEGSFVKIREAIEEEAAREPKKRAYIIDPDDPQKGQWGGTPTRGNRTLSAEVRPVSDEWFIVSLRVAGEGLEGDVTFHLHPTFQPNTLTVTAKNNVAVIETQAYGAFTVGAATDTGNTLLELDLAQDPSFPQTFRER